MVFNGKTITPAVKQLQTGVFTVKQFVEVVGQVFLVSSTFLLIFA